MHSRRPMCPLSPERSVPLATSQNVTSPVELDDPPLPPAQASVCPSGLQATYRGVIPCLPLRAGFSWPAATSHKWTELLPVVMARVLPSGLNASESMWYHHLPLKVARSAPVAASQ